MKKILGKLGKYLYCKFGEPDFVAMTRQQLQGKPKHAAFENLSKEEQQVVINDCNVLTRNPSLHYVANEIINEMVEHTAYRADSELIMLCNRFTINGVSLFEERIKKYSAMVEQPEETFDKHEPI